MKQALLEQPNGDKNKTSIENIQNELREEIDNNRQLGADNAPVFNNRYLQKMWGWGKKQPILFEYAARSSRPILT